MVQRRDVEHLVAIVEIELAPVAHHAVGLAALHPALPVAPAADDVVMQLPGAADDPVRIGDAGLRPGGSAAIDADRRPLGLDEVRIDQADRGAGPEQHLHVTVGVVGHAGTPVESLHHQSSCRGFQCAGTEDPPVDGDAIRIAMTMQQGVDRLPRRRDQELVGIEIGEPVEPCAVAGQAVLVGRHLLATAARRLGVAPRTNRQVVVVLEPVEDPGRAVVRHVVIGDDLVEPDHAVMSHPFGDVFGLVLDDQAHGRLHGPLPSTHQFVSDDALRVRFSS